ncbi:beta-glucosidase [Alkalibacterium putridalgicola]|uniref:beta-glucosidase n=1 Tax=Alkalibacterium putridalgicola TaxID=426703 RepID=A0A1H7QIT3_9LACT|nr:glycoside hydrolase family 3 N-terminal domain-containing protein [Alkalibacterium putridalgicola]GEK88462.1 beta-glucosidase [Alkalibacterium putridalgicola]SEL47554.1 beta-glucosidase [Alkalibacterium putridalgicola]
MKEIELTELLNKMTLKEKIGQLSQIISEPYTSEDFEITGPLTELGIPQDLVPLAGSVLGASGAEANMTIQEQYLKQSRLKIPLIFMADIIHGYKTIFPIPLGIGSSWNTELAKLSARVSAVETAVSGLHVTFSPMVDLVRDPRWGRVMETTGEDKFLNERFAEAFVQGYQGEDYTDPYSIASCVKHFAGYGAPEGGRDYNTVNMSERQLREDYMSAYKAAVDSGTELVMTSFNTVDGIPSSGNRWLLHDVLREEWGFDGVVISDWGAVKELLPHGVAADEKEAARKAINATLDIEMMTFTYIKHLEELINEGSVSEQIMDDAVLRILRLKNKLGLFENPYRSADAEKEKELVFSEDHREKACKVAEESMVLLKNDAALPLNVEKQKIALIGPFSKGENMLGAWSWKGEPESASQLLDSLKDRLPAANLLYAKGSEINTTTEKLLTEAEVTASKADVIVLALGESADMSGEAASLTDIRLPNSQIELLKRLSKLDKPIVTVLFNGRPLDLNNIDKYSDAILEAWFPGSEGGSAISNILIGRTNPSGKLPMSFPENVGQIPVYYNHFSTGRPVETTPDKKYSSKYLDCSNYPKYAFGYGLSYTTFKYSDLTLSDNELKDDEALEVTVTVTNSGPVRGKEVVQLYVRDLIGEVVRPERELKGFEKITLDSGESTEVTFKLTRDMLSYVHSDLSVSADEGEFEVFAGGNSLVTGSKKFVIK